jgi:hypothetical protein
MTERQGKDEGFKVPKNYFKTLPDQVLEQIKPQPFPAKQPNWLEELALFFQSLFQPRYAVAFASAAILLAAAYFCFLREKPVEPSQPVAEVKLEDIPDGAIQEYISNNIEDLDKDMILEKSLAAEEVKTLPNIAPKPDVKEMEQYLDENIEDIDLEDLEDML